MSKRITIKKDKCNTCDSDPCVCGSSWPWPADDDDFRSKEEVFDFNAKKMMHRWNANGFKTGRFKTLHSVIMKSMDDYANQKSGRSTNKFPAYHQKLASILQDVQGTDILFVKKVKVLSKLISDPDGGHILDSRLVDWAKKVGIKVENHCEDRTSWWTCRF